MSGAMPNKKLCEINCKREAKHFLLFECKYGTKKSSH